MLYAIVTTTIFLIYAAGKDNAVFLSLDPASEVSAADLGHSQVLPQPSTSYRTAGQAAVFVDPPCDLSVTTTSDGPAGSGSLRSAIICANGSPGLDTITLPAGTYILSMAGTGEDISGTGDLDITDDLTLNGAGAATSVIDGAQIDRVFDVVGAVTVTFSGITVTHGQAVDCRPAPGLPSCGGAILSNSLDTDLPGTVNITNSVITNSTTTGGGADGGAIFVSGTHRTTNITGTTISGNTTFYGGAIAGGGILSVVSSTISGNSAGFYGGGIYNQGTAVVLNSTFSGNSAGNSGGGILSFTDITITNSTFTANVGGGVDGYSGTTSVYNSIITGQTSGPDCSGSITSHGYNLEGSTSCGFTTTGDLQNANPLLGPLQNNGGLTLTHELLEFSPAINTIPTGVNGCGTTITTDQRGVSRPQETGCDIGSFEAEPLHCVPPPSGIVGWWPGDGNANDIQGPTFENGVVQGNAFYSSGKVEQAFSFDGSQGSFVEILDSPYLNPTDAFTVDGWFYIDPFAPRGSNDVGTLVSKSNGELDSYWSIYFDDRDNLKRLRFVMGSNVSYANAIPAANWYHVAGTFDSASSPRAKLYLNGSLVADSGSDVFNVTPNDWTLRIGAMHWTESFGVGNDRLNGKADEVEFLNKALSPTQIQAIYDAGSAGRCRSCTQPPSGMISWWPAEGNAVDIRGGNDGSLYATASFAGGKVGQAFNFDGEGSVVIPDADSLDVTTSFTLEAWVNPVMQNSYQGAVISKTGGVNGNKGYQLGLAPSTNLLYCEFNAAGEPWPQNRTVSETPVPAGTWSHIACTYDHNILAVYLNGLMIASTTVGPKSVVNTTSNLRISGDDNFALFYKGLVDEPAVYGRALTAGEIQSIDHAGSTGKCSVSATAFDYDGDGKTDISIFRPLDGAWYLLRSTEGLYGAQFGYGDDRIVPADYTGDGRTDVAVFRPSTGLWYILNGSTGRVTYFVFGIGEDLPTPADYDGDGKADISVFRPSTATWYRQNSSDGSFYAIQFGLPEDKPTVGDFDGDGKADIAIFRPLDGAWYQLYSSDGSLHGRQFGFGSDIITPADYDGDGKTDIAVFRPSNGYWYLATSQSETVQYRVFGLAGDIPAVGDFDGDGKADVSVFRPSDGTWYRTNSSDGSFYAYQFGTNGDKPTMTAFRY